MRGYVLWIIGSLAVTLSVALAVSWFGIDQCPLADRNVCGIYHFQRARLASAAPRIDLLLLGDSSLGNDVDGRLMQKLVGRPTVHLALSGGSLGLPAIYVQLRQALASHSVKNVVIMLSPEGFRHKFSRSAEGYVFVTGGNPLALFSISPMVGWKSLGALASILFDDRVLRFGLGRILFGLQDPGDCRGCVENDYVVQTRTGFLDNGDLEAWRGPRDDFDPFLARIGALCRTNDVNCLYMHGPILQEAIDLNPGYVAAIDAKVERFGLNPVDPQPITFPRDEAGDAINHVRPDLRATYTERVFRQIAPLLQ